MELTRVKSKLAEIRMLETQIQSNHQFKHIPHLVPHLLKRNFVVAAPPDVGKRKESRLALVTCYLPYSRSGMMNNNLLLNPLDSTVDSMVANRPQYK